MGAGGPQGGRMCVCVCVLVQIPSCSAYLLLDKIKQRIAHVLHGDGQNITLKAECVRTGGFWSHL